jgi:hypothetical protein
MKDGDLDANQAAFRLNHTNYFRIIYKWIAIFAIFRKTVHLLGLGDAIELARNAAKNGAKKRKKRLFTFDGVQ